MSDRNEEVLLGTNQRKKEIVKVGRPITETGVIKVTSYEEKITPEGVLERITTVEFGQPDCGHVGREIGAQCPICQRWYCRECSEKYGICYVCGGLACPHCSDSTVLDKNKRYHRACWKESIRRKIFK